MNDNELLELIAERAPAPTGDYADRLVAAGRRARGRRRVAVAGAVLCAVVAVAAPAIVWNGDGRGDGRDGGGQEVTAVQSVPAGVQAEVYAAAISAVLSEAMPAAEIAEYYLLDQLCDNVLSPGKLCKAEPLPADVRRGLVELEHRRIHFAAAEQEVRGLMILVTLGPIRWVRDDLAEVPVSFRQGQDGRGLAYRIQLRGGEWQFIGPASGQRWIN